LIGPAGKAHVGLLAERFWAAGFSMIGPFSRQRLARYPYPEPYRRPLIVAPHPDDESIGCAGTILLHKRAGARVIVACVTDGRTSRAFGLDADEMARRRRLEAETCARRLGIDDLEWMGLRGDDWDELQLFSSLESVMGRHRPDVVYAPSCVDFHPEHRKVADGLSRFWKDSSTKPEAVRVYPLQVPLTPVLANLAVDVTDVMPQAREAMDAYATQIANLPRAFRQRRYAARWYGVGDYCEEFWQLGVAAYVQLHEEFANRAGVRFRGVRDHPVSDPLAYLTGWRARRRLAESTSS